MNENSNEEVLLGESDFKVCKIILHPELNVVDFDKCVEFCDITIRKLNKSSK